MTDFDPWTGFGNAPFTEREAWFWLREHAPDGVLRCSVQQVVSTWGWSRASVWRFIAAMRQSGKLPESSTRLKHDLKHDLKHGKTEAAPAIAGEIVNKVETRSETRSETPAEIGQQGQPILVYADSREGKTLEGDLFLQASNQEPTTSPPPSTPPYSPPSPSSPSPLNGTALPALGDLPRSAGGRRRYPEPFLEFWTAFKFRRQTDTQADAYTAWRSCRKRGVDNATIVDGALRYAAYLDTTGKRAYAALAATWLNRDGWTAEYEARADLPNETRVVLGALRRMADARRRQEAGGSAGRPGDAADDPLSLPLAAGDGRGR